MTRRTKLGQKALLAGGALVVALGVAEAVVRMVGVPSVPRPTLFTASGVEVPLGEVIVYTANRVDYDSRHNLRQEVPHGLLLANLKLRWGYDPLPRWSYFDANGCVAIDTNSLGLRDEEFAAAKRPGELRLLAIGDSMTYGMGVRLDLTWPQVLEQRLRAEREGPVEVINAGFAAGGTDPGGYDAWLLQNGIHFEPDVVVIGLCLNDLSPQIGMLTYPKMPLEPILGGWSLLLDRSVQLVRQRQARAEPRDLGTLVTDETPSWLSTQRGLRAMRDGLQSRDIPLVVAVFPMMSQLEPELYPAASLHRRIVEFCRRESIACLDLLPFFLGLDDEELWVHSSDQHANDRGHAIQAEQLHRFLREQGLLPDG